MHETIGQPIMRGEAGPRVQKEIKIVLWWDL